jgi:hypothetical protein
MLLFVDFRYVEGAFRLINSDSFVTIAIIKAVISAEPVEITAFCLHQAHFFELSQSVSS